MNNKIKINGQELDKLFNLRTTNQIFDKMLSESQDGYNGSVNFLLNSILKERYFSKISKTKKQ